MFYTLKEASSVVELSANSLRKYINQGKVKAVKKGRDWFISTATINKLLERKTTDAIN